MKITKTHLIFNGHAIPRSQVDNLLNEDLTLISMADLVSLLSQLGGIPGNILEYLIQKIKLHDKSKAVNSFLYNGNEYWFDKNTRMGLMNLLSCGEPTIQISLGDSIVEFNSLNFKKFLQDLEIYASKCYITTAKHLNSVQKLEKLEDIINYDYTLGYPDKITLSNE